MEKTIQLKPKQQAILQSTQAEKQKVQKLFSEIQQKEVSIIELILEANEVKGLVSKYDIKGDKLILTFIEPKIGEKLPAKPKKQEPKETK